MMKKRPPKWRDRRRAFANGLAAVGVVLALLGSHVKASDAAEPGRAPTGPKVALIDTTDLYHPPQDPGDNFDLIAAYAIPEVDLKAVILDVTEKYRRPPEGPRDPGFIPVLQLNSIFGRNVPCGTTPYLPMKSPDDQMLDAPSFQQAGIELLLETLRHAADKVETSGRRPSGSRWPDAGWSGAQTAISASCRPRRSSRRTACCRMTCGHAGLRSATTGRSPSS
jgi:hypothetical protein